MANKRKIASALSLGATAAGAVSSSAASANLFEDLKNGISKGYDYVSGKIKDGGKFASDRLTSLLENKNAGIEKLKKLYSTAKDNLKDTYNSAVSGIKQKYSESCKSLQDDCDSACKEIKQLYENIKTKMTSKPVKKSIDMNENDKACSAAINIAYSIYTLLESNCELIIDKLKELCLSKKDNALDEILKELIVVAKGVEIDDDEIMECLESVKTDETGKTGETITENCILNVEAKKNEDERGNTYTGCSTIKVSEKDENNNAGDEKTFREIQIPEVELSFSKVMDTREKINRVRYSGSEFCITCALERAISNLEKIIFRPNTLGKNKKLIAFLVFHKCKDSAENAKKLIGELLDIQIENEKIRDKYTSELETKLHDNKDVYSKLYNAKNELSISKKIGNLQNTVNFFKEELKSMPLKVVDSKLARSAITGAGVIAGGAVGVALAPLGLGIVGIGVLAITGGSVLNMAADLLNKDNRSWEAWSLTSIQNRYKGALIWAPVSAISFLIRQLYGAGKFTLQNPY